MARQKSLEFLIAARQGDVSGIARTVQGLRGVADGADRTQGRLAALSQTRVDLEQGLKSARVEQQGIAAEMLRREKALAAATQARVDAEEELARRRTAANATRGDRDAGPAAVRAREEARQVAAGAKRAEAAARAEAQTAQRMMDKNRADRERMVQRLASTRDQRTVVGAQATEQRDAAAAKQRLLLEKSREQVLERQAALGNRQAQRELETRRLLQRQLRDREALAAAARAELALGGDRVAIEQRIGRQLRDQRAERRALGEERKRADAERDLLGGRDRRATLRDGRRKQLEVLAGLGDRRARNELEIARLVERQRAERAPLLALLKSEAATTKQKVAAEKQLLGLSAAHRRERRTFGGGGVSRQLGRSALSGLAMGGSYATAGMPGLAGAGAASGGGLALGAATAGVAVAGAGIAYGLIKAVGVAKNLEAELSRVEAITGLTAKQLAPLREQAIERGANTTFTPAEVAQAQGNLALAGQDSEQILATTPAVLNLAEAGAMDLGDAATRLTKIMGGLGIEAADATGTVDVLAAVMSSANTNVPELANALEKVAPIAAAVNLPLEEVAATLGVLADNGFTGELAGTALRGMLLKLAAPLGPARQALADYGIELKDTQGQLKAMPELLMAFRDGLTGVSESDRLKVFKLVFQEEGAGAFAALFNDGPEVLEKAVASLQNVAGRAEKQASVLLDNLDGDVKKLGNALTGVGTTIGDLALTPLRELAQGLTTGVKAGGGLLEMILAIDDATTQLAETATRDSGLRNLLVGADGTGGLGAGVDAAMNYFGTGSSRMGAGRSGEGGDVVEDFARSLGGIFTGGDFGGPFRFLGKEIAGLTSAILGERESRDASAEAIREVQETRAARRGEAEAQVNRNPWFMQRTEAWEEEVGRVMERLRNGFATDREAQEAAADAFAERIRAYTGSSERAELLAEDDRPGEVERLRSLIAEADGEREELEAMRGKAGDDADARRLAEEKIRAIAEDRLRLEEKLATATAAEATRERSEARADAAPRERGEELLRQAGAEAGDLGAVGEMAALAAADPLREAAAELRASAAGRFTGCADSTQQDRQAGELALADRLEAAADRAATDAAEAAVRGVERQAVDAMEALRAASLGDRARLAEPGTAEARGAAANLAAFRMERDIAARREAINDLLGEQQLSEEQRAAALQELATLEQRERPLVERARADALGGAGRAERPRFVETPTARFAPSTSRDVELGARLQGEGREVAAAERTAQASTRAAEAATKAAAMLKSVYEELKRQGGDVAEVFEITP